MIGDVGSSSNRPSGVSLPGGLPSGSYRSESSGARRTVVAVPPEIEQLLPKSPQASITAKHVAAMRDVVKARYGAAVAQTAFREIDYRQTEVERGFLGRFGLKSGKDVQGHHLMTATLRALELASPHVRASRMLQQSEATLAQVKPAAADLEQRLKSKKQEIAEIFENYSPMNDSLRVTRLRNEIAALEPQLKRLQNTVDQAKKEKEAAQATLDNFKTNPLDETALGKAQQGLDKVDGDPRFRALLNDTYARGQAVHGKGGTAHRITPTASTPKAVAKQVVGTALPPVGVGLAFYSAIRAEDRQRRLGNAARFLDDHPVAKSVAKSMEAGAEVEKNKAAITGTVSFVAMGATAHFGPVAMPGLKAIGNPISGAIGRGVSTALTGHVSHVGTQAISSSASVSSGRMVGEIQNRTASSILPTGKGVSSQTRAVAIDVPLPEGTVAPTVPVKIETDQGARIKEFGMGEAGPALLHYLGAQVGDTSDPNEQNRADLRKLFGAQPDEHLDPKVERSRQDRELDQKIADALDDPDRKGSAELIRSVSPLRLLHIAQGWR